MTGRQEAALLVTKLHAPRLRLEAVARPRLLAELDEGLRQGRRLTLVCAPAGFGKSTLLASWLHARSGHGPHPAGAWLALDGDDADPMRFLTYLIAALQQVAPELGRSVFVDLQAPVTATAHAAAAQDASQEDWTAPLLAALVQDLAAIERPLDAPLILVLDDYHELASPPVDRLVARLLERAPPSLHIAIATRSEPALPVARLRVHRELTEVRSIDLRFTPAEATLFLNNTMNLQVPAASEALLFHQTEGWPAGMQLAALSLRTMNGREAAEFVAGFGGSDRHIADYLVEEVLQRQPPVRRDFLLRTSILRRLCAPLCAALLEDIEPGAGSQRTAQALLEECDRQSLFLLPLDNQRNWYRYHHLFAGHLQARLQRESPELFQALQRRAGDWCAQAGDGEEAMHHLLAAGDRARAAAVAEQYGVQMVGGSRLRTFLRWCDHLGDDVLRQHPFLCAGLGWACVLTGQVERALAWVDAGAAVLGEFEGIDSLPDNRRITQAEVSGHLYAVRAYAARLQRDTEGVARYSRAALAGLPADADTVRCTLALNWGILEMEQDHEVLALAAFAEAHQSGRRNAANLFVALSALGLQGDLHVRAGRLTLAEHVYRQVISEGDHPGVQTPPAVAVGYFGLAQVHLWRGEFATARQCIEEGVRRAEQLAFSEAMHEVLMLKARIALGEGRSAEAEALLASAAEQMAQATPHTRLQRSWTLLRLATYLAQGNLAEAAPWVDAQTAGAARDLSVASLRLHLEEQLLRSRILLASGSPAAALAILGGLSQQGSPPFQCERAVLTAQCYLSLGVRHSNQQQAESALASAVAIAAPERLRLPFLPAQPALTKLLRTLAGQGPHAAFAASLLPQAVEIAPLQPGLAEPLSERELEVLHLLAAGLTNAEIAATLIVAPSTVKTHVNRILAKLAAANRTQAVARARELGLLTG